MGYNQLKAFMEYNMTDTADSCGTGLGGTITHPTDPVGDSSITARGSINGIHVSWTYPAVNPHAVAYFILFRANSANVTSSVEIARGALNYYVDTNEDLETETTYYYWVQSVSINGTMSNLVGPASATMRPSITEIVEALVEKIKESALDQALRDKIAQIDVMTSAFNTATAAGSLAGELNQEILSEWSEQLDDQGTLIADETYQRKLENGNLAGSISAVAAQAEDNAATFLNEAAVTATAEGVTASAIQTLRGNYEGNLGTLQTMQELVLGEDGLAAKYTVKSEIEGYVTGFGHYNDGTESAFLVHADTFALGAPTPIGENEHWPGWGGLPAAEVYPFAVSRVGNTSQYRIHLNAETVILDGHIKNAMIGGTINSDDYDGYTKGWAIYKGTATTNSLAVFHNIYARGNIEASDLEADKVMVNTLHIQGNAVTVPRYSRSGLKTGNGNLITCHTPGITLAESGNIMISVNFQQGYSDGQKSWGFKVTHIVKVNGVELSTPLINRSGMQAVTDFSTWVGMKINCNKGYNSFRVEWLGEDNTIKAKATTTLMGAMR